VCHLAGEILVSTVGRDLVRGGPDVAFLERGDVELKGIHASVV
jgi:class 3 adenylate cyclase